MKRRAFLRSSFCVPLGLVIPKTAFSNIQYEWAPRKPTIGPLKSHPQNSRYFTDGSGKAIYLTGSHMGWELQDDSWGRKHKFDFSGFLDFLVKHNHNLIRMWIVEHTRWDNSNPEAVTNPMPYLRTGPDQALDGGLKYNLKRFNPEYFKRLRSRVKAAGEKGIYVLIMLFQGFSLHIRSNRNPWFGHPFNKSNNINGVSGDLNHDRDGREIHTLRDPKITALQERYVRKVVDTVNDLDNVLFEIGNECGAYATQWQYYMIKYIKEYESSKPKQHPIGMTVQIFGGKNAELFESPADWISPNREGGYRDNPPAADGSKVIISDTDHHGAKPYPERRVWVWKSFLRGHNPIFLDMYPEQETKQIDEIVNSTLDPRWEPIRYAMGMTRRLANRIDLASMIPNGELSSTGYCLANPGNEYLIYQPKSNEAFSVVLVEELYQFSWINPQKGDEVMSGRIESLGGRSQFKAPFDGDSALYIKTVNDSE